ncbi:MAG: DUF3073 domain-containing protein [Actinomycetota bacterium]|nr:DUF3073 domain-containing protein [Actinomycetota bacterium]
MGRGRAKAKQTKVARELKYGGPQTDFDRLQAELGSNGASTPTRLDDTVDVVEDPYADDPYAKYYDDEDGVDSQGPK